LRIAIVDDTGLRATILKEGLAEAGYIDIEVVAPHGGFVARLERMAPDIVLMDLGDPSRDTLEEMLTVSRALARPIAMFVDRSDDAMIGAAIDAGVSAYVVDGLRKERVKPILELAIRRFNAFNILRAERDDAVTALADRKTIDYIRNAAAHGLYEIRGMGAKRTLPNFDDLVFLGASLSRYPLEGYREKCSTKTVLGTRFAKKPIELEIPMKKTSTPKTV